MKYKENIRVTVICLFTAVVFLLAGNSFTNAIGGSRTISAESTVTHSAIGQQPSDIAKNNRPSQRSRRTQKTIRGNRRRSASTSQSARRKARRNADQLAKVTSVQKKEADKRYDQPDLAAEYYRQKRAPRGIGAIPVERYLTALEHVKNMRLHSTVWNTFLPSQKEMGADASRVMALGTWTPLGPGNIGGRTRAIVINPTNPNIMYAGGVTGGVWKSTNAGASWTPMSDLLSNITVGSMAMDPANPNIIYIGTGEGQSDQYTFRGLGIFKSIDGGANWTYLATTNTQAFHFVNDIVISPANSQRLYAATRSGIMRSLDSGATWTQVHMSMLNAGCTDLVIRPGQVNDNVIAACGNKEPGEIRLNTDAGGAGTWDVRLSAQAEAGMGRSSLAIAASNSAVIYAMSASTVAGNYNDGLLAVFRSEDGGSTWTARVRNTDPIKLNTVQLANPREAFLTECGTGMSVFGFNQGDYDNVIAVDPANSDIVWAGGIDLFRSNDGGANWGIASYWDTDQNPGRAHADQHTITFHPNFDGVGNRIMYIGNDGGIYRTDDARAAVAVGPMARCNSNNTSVNWIALNNGYSATQFYHGLAYPNGTTYFGGTQDNATPRGTDAGGINGWTNLYSGDGGYVAVDPTNTNTLYFESQMGDIRKSIDGGVSHNAARSGITETMPFITVFQMDPTNPQRLYTGGTFVWRTSDAAANWVQASTALVGSTTAIAISPTDANNVLVGTGQGNIHRTNIGTTATAATAWANVQPRQGMVSWLAYDPTNTGIAYATYSNFNADPADRHVYKSIDGGVTWNGIDGAGVTGIPDVPAHSVLVDPNNTQRLFVGTDVGVFVTTNGGTTWARENTGFANVITESMNLASVGGVSNIFAFTHGRGVFRVSAANVGARRRFDFDGDGKSDRAVFRPSAGAWYILNSSNGSFRGQGFGIATDTIVPADYDGDGKTDIAVFRDGAWYWLQSTDGAFRAVAFGQAGDIPIPGDFDGDGKADTAVFRPTTGTWYYLRSSNGSFVAEAFGTNGDKPVLGDFDGDGRSDLAVFRPSNGTWYLMRSTDGFAGIAFGITTDTPVAADYDGDNKTDVAVYRDGTWHLLRSTSGYLPIAFGIPTDQPSPGDFDGDGKADTAVFRPAIGTWYVLPSSNGVLDVQQFGANGDRSVPGAFAQ